VREFPEEVRAQKYYVNLVYGTDRRAGYHRPSKPGEKQEEQYVGETHWAGATGKFFMAGIVPRSFTGVSVECLVRRKNMYPEDEKKSDDAFHSPPFTVVIYSDRFTLGPREQAAYSYSLFIGPKKPTLLRDLAKETGSDLNTVLFYDSWFGWMRALKLGLMHALNFLYSLVGSYGLAIVILTVLIRIVTHPIAHKGMKMQAKTMAEMRKIKPLLDEVNRKHKGDPAKKNQEMMKLYKEHGISPLAPLRGCLPMLLQIPIFFALYHLLNQAIDLRGAHFLWIEDLSRPDKLIDLLPMGLDFRIPIVGWHVTSVNLLPVLMGVSQFLMQKLTPTPTQDPSQKQMMLMFTIMFPVLLYNFPSGLFIYWLINNVWQSVHQLIANRIVRKEPEAKAAAVEA
jgi:YidC/Oxa1 family membrane protein insertase